MTDIYRLVGNRLDRQVGRQQFALREPAKPRIDFVHDTDGVCQRLFLDRHLDAGLAVEADAKPVAKPARVRPVAISIALEPYRGTWVDCLSRARNPIESRARAMASGSRV